MSDAFTPLSGGCTCGAVRFRLAHAPIVTHCCHCRECQKVSGSAFRVNTMIETDRIELLQGEPRPAPGVEKLPPKQCAACGLVLWSHHPHLGAKIAFVGVGVLDEGERLTPEAHYFTRSKHPWVVLPEGVPSFEANGRPDKPEAAARIGAVLASRPVE